MFLTFKNECNQSNQDICGGESVKEVSATDDIEAVQDGQGSGSSSEEDTSPLFYSPEAVGETAEQSEKVVGPTPEELESYRELMTFEVDAVAMEKSFEVDDPGYISSTSPLNSQLKNCTASEVYNHLSDNEALESLLSEILSEPPQHHASKDDIQQPYISFDKSFDVQSFLQADPLDNVHKPSSPSSPGTTIFTPDSSFTHLPSFDHSSPLSLQSSSPFSFEDSEDYFKQNDFDLNNLNDTSHLDLFSLL